VNQKGIETSGLDHCRKKRGGGILSQAMGSKKNVGATSCREQYVRIPNRPATNPEGPDAYLG